MDSTILGLLMLLLIALQAINMAKLKRYRYEMLNEHYKVLFRKEANAVGCHGYLLVNSRVHGLRDVIIPFVFEGVNSAPLFSLSLYKLIVDQATEAGYNVSHIVAYEGLKYYTPENKHG